MTSAHDVTRIRGEIRSFFNPEHDPIEEFTPDDPQNCGIYVEMLVGPMGSIGEEICGVTICTPRWLESQVSQTAKPSLGATI